MINTHTHSNRTSSIVLVLMVLTGVATAACDDDGAGPGELAGNFSNERLSITNEEATLQARVTYTDETVPVDAPVQGAFAPEALALASGDQGPLAAKNKELNLQLLAEVVPPLVAGEPVQATSVSIWGITRAVVSYNMRGAPRMGAIDWISTLRKDPRISTSVTFLDTDVSAIAWDGRYVYAAASTEPVEHPYPAVLERLRLRWNKFWLEENLQVPLTSYVGTSTVATGREVYATSGDGGHVFAFDQNTMELLGQYPLEDARWVAWDPEGDRVVVAQGTPGRLAVFEEGEFPGGSMKLLNTFTFPGAEVPESKSTVEIAGGKAFVAAGPDGVQVVCLDDGEVIGSVPRPDPGSLGLDPSVVVTNAVTVDDDLMFISNGEAGVYVAQGSKKFTKKGCEPQDIRTVGKLRFDEMQSANHVAFRAKWLVVAAGLGGVKVVWVDWD